jgi:predicted dehydrogenase
MGGVNCQYSAGNYGHTYIVNDMALALIEEREPMITGEEAKKSVDIILAIYESARTGKKVYL